MIEARSIPVRIRNLIARAGSDQQLVPPFGITCKRLSEPMMVEGKAAFEAAGNVWIGSLPASPLRQRQQSRQIVTPRQLFEQEVRQRRRRFADGKARMPPALE